MSKLNASGVDASDKHQLNSVNDLFGAFTHFFSKGGVQKRLKYKNFQHLPKGTWPMKTHLNFWLNQLRSIEKLDHRHFFKRFKPFENFSTILVGMRLCLLRKLPLLSHELLYNDISIPLIKSLCRLFWLGRLALELKLYYTHRLLEITLREFRRMNCTLFSSTNKEKFWENTSHLHRLDL